MVKYLSDHQTHFTDIVQLGKVGLSSNKKSIWSIQLSSNPKNPKVALLAGLHNGDSIGTEILLMFVHYLTKSYKEDNAEVKQLLDSVSVYILPTISVDYMDYLVPGACNSTLNSQFNIYNSFKLTKVGVAVLYFPPFLEAAYRGSFKFTIEAASNLQQ